MYTEKTNIDDLLKKVVDKNSQNNSVENLNESKHVNLVSENESNYSVGDPFDKILHDAMLENANKSIEKIRNKLSNFSESFENKSYYSTISQHDLFDKINGSCTQEILCPKDKLGSVLEHPHHSLYFSMIWQHH